MPSQNTQITNNNQFNNNQNFNVSHALDFISKGAFSDCQEQFNNSTQKSGAGNYSSNKNALQQSTNPITDEDDKGLLEKTKEAISTTFGTITSATSQLLPDFSKSSNDGDNITSKRNANPMLMNKKPISAIVSNKLSDNKQNKVEVEQEQNSGMITTMSEMEASAREGKKVVHPNKLKRHRIITTQSGMEQAAKDNKSVVDKAKQTVANATESVSHKYNQAKEHVNDKLFDKQEEDKSLPEKTKEKLFGVKEENKGLVTKAKEKWNGEVADEDKGILDQVEESTKKASSVEPNREVNPMLMNEKPISTLVCDKLSDTKEEDKAVLEKAEETMFGVKEENKGLITKTKEKWNGEVADEDKGIIDQAEEKISATKESVVDNVREAKENAEENIDTDFYQHVKHTLSAENSNQTRKENPVLMNETPIVTQINNKLFDKEEEQKAVIEKAEEAAFGTKDENKGLITKIKENWNNED